MKKTFLSILFSMAACALFAQIKNPGFELLKDTVPAFPANWLMKSAAGFEGTIDNDVKHEGARALRITGNQEDLRKNMMFSQPVPLEVNKLKRIAITVYIKTDDVKGSVALWCQVWDKNGKTIGFQNIQSQGVLITGTGDWKKYAMPLTVNSDAKKLYMGAYLMGNGTAWFDDFAIEDIKGPDEPAPDSVMNYIEEFSGIVKKNSIFSDVLNWPQVESDIKELSKGVKTIGEAKVVTDYILQLLKGSGDNHSFLQSKVGAQQYASGNTSQQKVTYKLLGNNIGYIAVPGFGSVNAAVAEEFATGIQDDIRKLDTENQIKGWIVDLRGNPGGNMHPMIAGLGPIIGEGDLGYFVKTVNGTEFMTPWHYAKGAEGTGSITNVEVKSPYYLKNPDTKTAVLIGPGTSSSGEMTTLSFVGKKGTKLFGEATGGFTTGNSGFKLSNGAVLYLASSYTADRNKRKYMGKLEPDVTVKSIPDNDMVLKTAVDWVLGL